MSESKSTTPQAEKRNVLQLVMGLIYGKDGKFQSQVPEGAVRPKPAPVPTQEK